MTDEPFNPYDDAIPISQRIGMQRLGPAPEEVDEIQQAVASWGQVRSITPPAPKRRWHRPAKTGPTLPARPRSDRRELVSTSLEIVGIAAFSAGFWLIHIWLGLMVSGLCLILLGVATSNQIGRRRD